MLQTFINENILDAKSIYTSQNGFSIVTYE